MAGGAALALVLLVLTACGGKGDNARAPDPAPGPVDIELIVDLYDYVDDSLPYVSSYSEGYAVPTAADLDRFDNLASALINRQFDSVRTIAASSNFELVKIVDTGSANNEIYCLRERVLSGHGLYCIDPDATTRHHISAPHPQFDLETNVEAVAVMRGTGARYLSISTTHRCANAAASPCSGTTSVCGATGPYKVSDPAHNVDAFFQRFGIAVHDSSASGVTIQLHGCGSIACPANGDDGDIVARISAGTADDLPATELVNVLTAELNEELQPLQMGAALSCSEPVADKQLCGTTNTLGRYINGQTDPCDTPASSFAGSRWLHIEQSSNLRRDDGAGDEVTPAALIRAINEAVATP